MNNGKRFETDFKNSIPKDTWFYRFRDGTANWNRNDEQVRFQQSNICDCMLYNGILWLLELKTSNGKSLPFSNIRPNQLKDLCKAELYGIKAGFIIKLDNQTYYISAGQVKEYINTADRKSIPLKWLDDNGTFIASRKLQVNYRYDIGKLIEVI